MPGADTEALRREGSAALLDLLSALDPCRLEPTTEAGPAAVALFATLRECLELLPWASPAVLDRLCVLALGHPRFARAVVAFLAAVNEITKVPADHSV